MRDGFLVRTFGCQMNKHDSERVSGLLRASGMTPAADAASADVIVFMTCCVRENADERLYGQVASVKAASDPRSRGPLLAVGGCIGQRDGEAVLDRVPQVDVVFGTHNLSRLPSLLEAAREAKRPVVELADASDEFASDLPADREHPWHAWVPIAIGCDNFCSYCIVPHVRGRERSRALEDITEECGRLADEGVVEVTLLGQNVNSYGRDLYGKPRFADVLGLVARSGVRRIRFATSHPKDLSDETIRVMAALPQVAQALHLPVQSGADRVLSAMNRSYTRESYLDLTARIYDAMPAVTLSTDIIVGFPGETEADFVQTLEVVEAARFDQAFTFLYSPRAGTPAASMPDRVDHDVAQERFERLVSVVQRLALEKNRRLIGTVQDVLFTGPSKRDDRVLSGRSEGNKVVHVPLAHGESSDAYAGRFAGVRIDDAQTWFLSGYIPGGSSGPSSSR